MFYHSYFRASFPASSSQSRLMIDVFCAEFPSDAALPQRLYLASEGNGLTILQYLSNSAGDIFFVVSAHL